MERKSLVERLERLENRRDQLDASAPQPTAVHVQTVKVLADLLSMGERFSTGKVHPGLRAMMRMLRRLEPELVKELSAVPPAAIAEFLAELARRMMSVVEVERGASGAGADQPGANQPQTA